MLCYAMLCYPTLPYAVIAATKRKRKRKSGRGVVAEGIAKGEKKIVIY